MPKNYADTAVAKASKCDMCIFAYPYLQNACVYDVPIQTYAERERETETETETDRESDRTK